MSFRPISRFPEAHLPGGGERLRRLRIPLALLTLTALLVPSPATAVCEGADIPPWASRNSDGDLVVERYLGSGDFTVFDRSRETSCMGWPLIGNSSWGPNEGYGPWRNGGGFLLPRTPDGGNPGSCNSVTDGRDTIVYEHLIDGYHGKPVGQNYCTNSAPEPGFGPNDCNPQDGDLVRAPWGGCFGEILMKNVEWINNIRNGGNHDDVVQACKAQVDGWVVVQNSIWKNTDTHVTNFKCFNDPQNQKGIAFHDVEMGHDQGAKSDCATRVQQNINPGENCGLASITRPGDVDMPLWLVGFQTYGSSFRFGNGNQGGRWTRFIVIDTDLGDFSNESSTPITQYPSIEAAVAAGEELFPYAHLACAGWDNPPPGCVNGRGPLAEINENNDPRVAVSASSVPADWVQPAIITLSFTPIGPEEDTGETYAADCNGDGVYGGAGDCTAREGFDDPLACTCPDPFLQGDYTLGVEWQHTNVGSCTPGTDCPKALTSVTVGGTDFFLGEQGLPAPGSSEGFSNTTYVMADGMSTRDGAVTRIEAVFDECNGCELTPFIARETGTPNEFEIADVGPPLSGASSGSLMTWEAPGDFSPMAVVPGDRAGYYVSCGGAACGGGNDHIGVLDRANGGAGYWRVVGDQTSSPTPVLFVNDLGKGTVDQLRFTVTGLTEPPPAPPVLLDP